MGGINPIAGTGGGGQENEIGNFLGGTGMNRIMLESEQEYMQTSPTNSQDITKHIANTLSKHHEHITETSPTHHLYIMK